MRAERKLHGGVVGRQSAAKIPPMRLELSINGMVAVHAKQGVFTALAGVPGVLRAEVELGRAVVEIEESVADVGLVESQLRSATELVGYQVTEIRRSPRSLPLL